MNCFVTLDIGTSAIKCAVVSEEGLILSSSSIENKYFYSQKGKVEFSVTERYRDICNLIRYVVDKKDSNASVRAICLSGASGNALLLDKVKKPLANAVSWLDKRAESSYQTLLSSFSPNEIYSITGWPTSKSFPLSYFAWMKNNEPDIYYSAQYHATDFVYYNYRLSGNWVIDTSTATNFYMQDQVKMKYYSRIIDFLDIDEKELPEIVKSGIQIGNITAQAAMETNLPEGVPVISGSFDHPAAARGAGMIEVGDLLISCGTSWVFFIPFATREKIQEEKFLTDPFLSPDGGPWGGMFSFPSMGALLNEYISILFNNSATKFSEFEREVINSSNKNNNCDFDIFQKDVSPKDYLRMKLENNSLSQVCKSIAQCVFLLIQKKVVDFQNMNIPINRISLVGGCSNSKIWTQIFSNAFNKSIMIGQNDFAGCVGSAVLAGIGIGLFKNEIDGYKKMDIKLNTVTPNNMMTL